MFKKKKKVTAGVRKREEEDMTTGGGEDGQTEIVHAAKRAKKDFEIQATSKKSGEGGSGAGSSSGAGGGSSSSSRFPGGLFDDGEIVSGDKALSMADAISAGKGEDEIIGGVGYRQGKVRIVNKEAQYYE
jgi:hypothetical protein